MQQPDPDEATQQQNAAAKRDSKVVTTIISSVSRLAELVSEADAAKKALVALQADAAPLKDVKDCLKFLKDDKSKVGTALRTSPGGSTLTAEAWSITSMRSRDELVTKSLAQLRERLASRFDEETRGLWRKLLEGDESISYLTCFKHLRDSITEYTPN